MLSLNTLVSDKEMKERLAKKGIKINTLSDYYMTKKQVRQHLFIMDYSNIQMDKLSEAFDIMYQCIQP